MDKKYYFLKDDHLHYVSESNFQSIGSYDFQDALKIKDINELITTIPIMADWNWDYSLFLFNNGEKTKIADKIWQEKYWKWEKENPKDYEKLYPNRFKT